MGSASRREARLIEERTKQGKVSNRQPVYRLAGSRAQLVLYLLIAAPQLAQPGGARLARTRDRCLERALRLPEEF